MNKTKQPFYLCNKEKCIKIINKKSYFLINNQRIFKRNLELLKQKDLLKIWLFSKYNNKNEIIKTFNKYKRSGEFNVDLFKKNFIKDLNIRIEDVEFNYFIIGDNSNGIMSIKIKDYVNTRKTKKIINYLEDYKKTLENLGIENNIKLNINILF